MKRSMLAPIAIAIATWLTPACRVVEPRLSAGYETAPPRSGWPAPLAYSSDALHPANRWRQRVFAPRGDDGRIAYPAPIAGGATIEKYSELDRAEVLVLLEDIAATPLEAGNYFADAPAQLRWDLLTEGQRADGLGDTELRDAYLRAAETMSSTNSGSLPGAESSTNSDFHTETQRHGEETMRKVRSDEVMK